MCGICGLIQFNGVPAEAGLIEQMCDQIQHRGPDARGVFCDRVTGLGMTRLSIIDLVGGQQPMANEDRTVWVVFNGEIYNYRELRSELEKRGHVFKTNSDTETIVHGYEEWGADCVQRLRGMFAFALWDVSHQRMFLARDRLGKKPLYYYLDHEHFVFGSEMKAILDHRSVPRRLNYAALDLFFSLGYVPAPYTILEGVHKLPAGFMLTVDGHSTVQQRRYWDIAPQTNRFTSIHEAREELQARLSQSVQMRLIADVPVGMLLSGGIDSSTVVALAAQHTSHLKTFSVGFSEDHLSELHDARAVATHLGTDHQEILVNHCSADLLRKLMWHMDEPSADPAIVPTFLVCQLARQSVKVVLTGEGGDEVFAGYRYYSLEERARRIHKLPAWFRHNALIPAARLVNFVRGKPRYHPRTLWNWALEPRADMLAWTAVFTDAEIRRIYQPGFQRSMHNHRASQHIAEIASNNAQLDTLERYLYLDMKLGLADGLLMKVDRMSMATSLEARTPLLDHQVVEFSFGLPSEYKISNGANKRILRLVAYDLLPASTTVKSKQIFAVPEQRWLSQELREVFWDLFQSHHVQELGIFSAAGVRTIWNQMLVGIPGASKQIWAILGFLLWHDLFINNTVPKSQSQPETPRSYDLC